MPMFGPVHAARMVGKNKKAKRSASSSSAAGEKKFSEWQREKAERVERLQRLRSASLASERWVAGFPEYRVVHEVRPLVWLILICFTFCPILLVRLNWHVSIGRTWWNSQIPVNKI